LNGWRSWRAGRGHNGVTVGQNDRFVQYVADLWSTGLEHSYPVTVSGVWRKWTEICLGSRELDWHCNSLSQAACHYSWSGGGSKIFEELSSILICQIKKSDDAGAAKTCKQIFEWGGVGRRKGDRSVSWIDGFANNGLCSQLSTARKLLINLKSDLVCFNGSDLLMNSAMTKVYAATEPKRLIIYDGRVGAALGLLAKRYLHSINHLREVPTELKFGWGASRLTNNSPNRNPSEGTFQFPPLFGVNRDISHAEMMRGASDMLLKVAAIIDKNDPTILSRLERALFMIGYNVGKPNR
jgi:hypothetical protein